MPADSSTAARRTPAEIEQFVSQWAREHVSAGVGSGNLLLEVDRFAARLTHDARAQGISGGDIYRVLGDIDVYLMEKCAQTNASG
jgi:hypothetical protein